MLLTACQPTTADVAVLPESGTLREPAARYL
jgi:hypothetical protein